MKAFAERSIDEPSAPNSDEPPFLLGLYGLNWTIAQKQVPDRTLFGIAL